MSVVCVSYLRCSGDSQILGDTWNRQTEKIQTLAASHGFVIEKEWREEGVSGKIECEQRPVFQTMLAELMSNGCRTIIVEDLSRLARRYAVQEQILLYLCSKDITLWTCSNGGENITEAMKADPTKRLLIGIVGLVSQWERETLVARNRAARQRIKEKGRLPGAKNYSPDHEKNRHADGKLRYGWKPGEEPILRHMLTLKGLGMKPKAIANKLNSEGISSRRGGKWGPAVVAKILAREKKKAA